MLLSVEIVKITRLQMNMCIFLRTCTLYIYILFTYAMCECIALPVSRGGGEANSFIFAEYTNLIFHYCLRCLLRFNKVLNSIDR